MTDNLKPDTDRQRYVPVTHLRPHLTSLVGIELSSLNLALLNAPHAHSVEYTRSRIDALTDLEPDSSLPPVLELCELLADRIHIVHLAVLGEHEQRRRDLKALAKQMRAETGAAIISLRKELKNV